MKLTCAIPTSQMSNKSYFFRRCLDSLWNQSFQDFEIVVTDNSDDDEIQTICEWYRTGIVYYRNPIKGMAQNTNEAIRRSSGDLIKILYMDDFLLEDDALEIMVKKFDNDCVWLVTGCRNVDEFGAMQNAHIPRYNDEIHTGLNTIGSPSVLTIRNKKPFLFDENLTWLLDCLYYKQMYEKYGEPKIIKSPLVGIGIGSHQMTNTMGDERKLQEHDYLNKIYE